MNKLLKFFLIVAALAVIGTGASHARINGGVKNKPQEKAKNIPRVYNPQQVQQSSIKNSSSSRNNQSNRNNRSNSKPSSNNRSQSSKQSNTRSSNSNKKPVARVNPAPVAPRVIPRVNTNTAPASTQTRVSSSKAKSSNNSNSKSNNNNSKRNDNKKDDKKKPSNVASAPAPRVIPRVNSNPSPNSNLSRPAPRVNSNANSNKPKAPVRPTVARNNSSNNKSHTHSGHNPSVGRNPDYSRARTLNTPASRAVLAQKWDSRQYQSSSIWDRARNYDDHDHHSDYHHNFSNSLNYAYRPTAWGNDPWWDQQDRHDYHNGCWDYGWNDRYTRHHSLDRNFYPPGYSRPSSGLLSNLTWGLAGWGLGSVAYDTGYNTYSNPYSAPSISYGSSSYSYAEPIAVASALRAPEPPQQVVTNEQLSDAAMDQSREYFVESDYVSALQKVDEAISLTPSDPVLHEFRSLNLFALGRYGDAAGVLNPILASGPGWDWDTMIGFYASDDVYTRQLRRLENYVDADPNSADSRFLLGYHYMVGGYLSEAREMFDQVVQIEPNDSVALQLRNLAESSMPVEEGAEDELDAPLAPAEMVAADLVEGEWRALSADGKTITLKIGTDGKFTWDYEGAAQGSVLAGDWSIDEDGLLVLNDGDVQLAGTIEMDGDNTMRFVLAGTPEGDPGLVFERM